jgi:hypothetical protein
MTFRPPPPGDRVGVDDQVDPAIEASGVGPAEARPIRPWRGAGRRIVSADRDTRPSLGPSLNSLRTPPRR